MCKTPATGQPEPIYGKVGPTPAFHVHMSKTNQIKEKIPLLNPRTEKYIGVDLRGPRSRVSPDTDHRSVGIAGKLACVPNICVQV